MGHGAPSIVSFHLCRGIPSRRQSCHQDPISPGARLLVSTSLVANPACQATIGIVPVATALYHL